MMLTKVREAVFRPKGFRDENALVESIARGCAGKRTAMITGNYTVKEGPDTAAGDPRLLGEEMLLTIELAARAYGRCVELGIEPPAIVIVPNDIAPGIFADNQEERQFKAAYTLPREIACVLSAHGLASEPAYLFTRDFATGGRAPASALNGIRRRLKEGTEKLVVIIESFAQNLASKALAKRRAAHIDEAEAGPEGKRLLAPVPITDTFSGALSLASPLVRITMPNGAPFCSFLAATLFREFEMLGFERMVNTFVTEEYPCVDKAAAAYKYMYGGKMAIRNIYLDGADVKVDSTINGTGNP
jgi:hypothetical protein